MRNNSNTNARSSSRIPNLPFRILAKFNTNAIEIAKLMRGRFQFSHLRSGVQEGIINNKPQELQAGTSAHQLKQLKRADFALSLLAPRDDTSTHDIWRATEHLQTIDYVLKQYKQTSKCDINTAGYICNDVQPQLSTWMYGYITNHETRPSEILPIFIAMQPKMKNKPFTPAEKEEAQNDIRSRVRYMHLATGCKNMMIFVIRDTKNVINQLIVEDSNKVEMLHKAMTALSSQFPFYSMFHEQYRGVEFARAAYCDSWMAIPEIARADSAEDWNKLLEGSENTMDGMHALYKRMLTHLGNLQSSVNERMTMSRETTKREWYVPIVLLMGTNMATLERAVEQARKDCGF